jgi:hypothetical protein
VSELHPDRSWWQVSHAPLQRAALWNPYFYRFFRSDHSQVPLGMRPLSGDESCGALSRVVEACGGTHLRPNMLKRCLAQMWATGYRPSAEYAPTFRQLAELATPDAPPSQQPVEALQAYGQQNYAWAPTRDAAPPQPVAPSSVAPCRYSRPSQVTFDGQVWTVRKEFAIDQPIDGVIALLDPMKWQLLSRYFKQTNRIESHKEDKGTGSWRGVLREQVAVNWNGGPVQSFDAFLSVDYSVTPQKVARADYSLEYEEDNQILIDDGFGEAYSLSPTLTRYTGFKRLKFASSFLNFMAPAVLCMFMEQDEDGFQDEFRRQAGAMAKRGRVGMNAWGHGGIRDGENPNAVP